MAVITGNGWEEAAKEMFERAKTAPTTMRKMVKAAAKVYEEELKEQIARYEGKGYGTGALAKSVKCGGTTLTPDGCKAEVWPQGRRVDKRHKKGERNETIGFVLEYGTGKIPARAWMSRASVIAEPKAIKAAMEVLEDG